MPINSLADAADWYKGHVRPNWKANDEAKSTARAVAEAYDYGIAKAKREHHEAGIAEMKESQIAGSLVELATVTKHVTDVASQVRMALERIPEKVSELLAVESSPVECHRILVAEIDEALDEIERLNP